MNSTNEDDPDYTMMSRRWSGEILITSDTAIEIARRVHLNHYGQADLSANEPLSVSEKGSHWLVIGAKKIKEIRPNETLDGPLVMKISKFDGQILSYFFALASGLK